MWSQVLFFRLLISLNIFFCIYLCVKLSNEEHLLSALFQKSYRLLLRVWQMWSPQPHVFVLVGQEQLRNSAKSPFDIMTLDFSYITSMNMICSFLSANYGESDWTKICVVQDESSAFFPWEILWISNNFVHKPQSWQTWTERDKSQILS